MGGTHDGAVIGAGEPAAGEPAWPEESDERCKHNCVGLTVGSCLLRLQCGNAVDGDGDDGGDVLASLEGIVVFHVLLGLVLLGLRLLDGQGRTCRHMSSIS